MSLAVTGGTAVRVQMWLETPAAWATDPRATHPVQLGWRAFDLAGEELASGAPWTSSRAGWALPEQPDDPLLPVAVGPRYDRQVADPRTFEVDVPEATARLELTALHLPPGGRALVVAFEEGTRDTVDQVRFVVGADAERAEKAAARMGPWGWDEMPLDWRQRASRSLWRRLASVSQADRPVRVASADAWLPMDDAAALGFAVPPGGAAAYNLEGEVVFDARWTAPDGREPRPTRTWLEVVGEGLGEVKDLGRVTEVGPLTFPPGTREVRIARDPFDEEGPTLLRASTTGPMRDRAWGDPPRLELEGGTQRLGPDLTGLIYWRADAGRPLLFGLPADHEIRVVARPRLPPGRLPGLGPAEPEPSGAVVLERVGRDRWTRDLPIAAIASPYERYTQGDDPRRPGSPRRPSGTSRAPRIPRRSWCGRRALWTCRCS
ncbi:MAG: hypothetical protein H6736_06760 [Alphaproteobacteria bacterium]|nr:hypothetical protein [Alphaproteobacteria bacterium]